MFLEAVCRAGIKRFYDYGTGECSTPAQAMQRTIDYVEKNWPQDNWEAWRWKYLYQTPVHETLHANQSELRILYKHYMKVKAKFLELDDAIRMFQDVPDIGLGASQIQYCFGMSKMTVIYERDKKASPMYTEIDFIEFLEFIGRIAQMKFQGSELQDQIDLATKIEYIIDDLFQSLELTRNEREEEDVASEEDGEENEDY